MYPSHSSTEEAVKSLRARVRSMIAFIADQLLQFWPPYRIEHEGRDQQTRDPDQDALR